MALNVSNGWTGKGIAPSWTVVQRILGGGTGNVAPAASSGGSNPVATTPGSPIPTATIPGAANYASLLSQMGFGGGGFSGGGGGGLPSIPPVGGGGSGMPPSMANPRGFDASKIPTPEQAYAMYLGQLGYATSTTPQETAMRMMSRGAGLPSSAFQPIPTSSWFPTADTIRQNNQASLWGQIALQPSRAYAYGAPAAHAPAQAPQWGYPTGYGQAPPLTQNGWGPSRQMTPGYGF